MIELKNVRKIYHSKKGNDTVALNNVNLKIGSRGMLFIIGKSGSGKSTLLNLLGGLDSLTSGELFINGKNISEFSQKKYDSYRNTYVGFIFQEFNILEQYNVYENIELALRLQNQKGEKENIDHLLNQLGLNNLGDRKINELSGGQKQRVAIARALIKKPKIILADEPTGNLDKSSGEQIFDILKEISKNQLVVVVSHDKESALKYADRIVEMEDGTIIHDSNATTDFQEEPFELKKSKLPISYAFKMAFTNFKRKPFKLFMTILLTAISLIFMGITVNCALFDRTMLAVNTMKDNKDYVYDVYYTKFEPMGGTTPLRLNESNIEQIQNITKKESNLVYYLLDNGDSLTFQFGENKESNAYYRNYFSYFQFVEVKDSNILGNIIGREPTQNNEIVVHKYFADYVMKFGILTSNNEFYFPKSYEELVDSKTIIPLGKNEVIITGIIDDDDTLYQKAKETGTFESDRLEHYFDTNYRSKAQNIYVKGFTENVTLRVDKEQILNYISITNSDYEKYQQSTRGNINILKDANTIVTRNGVETIFSLEKDEIILSIDSLKEFDRQFDEKWNAYLKEHKYGVYDDILKEFIRIYISEMDPSFYVRIPPLEDSIQQYISVKLVGVSLDENDYISNQYVEEYNPTLKRINCVRIYDDSTKNLTKSFQNMKYRESIDDEPGTYYNYVTDIGKEDLANVMNSYKHLVIYILIVSLVFVLFTFLLFSNFISVSISYCKKEIGILRALGANHIDVIKIFGYESIMIGMLSWILSIVGFYITCNILNQSMFGHLYYTLNGIVTHPLIPIIMFVYTICIAVLITTFSIHRIVKIKPIDAILNK